MQFSADKLILLRGGIPPIIGSKIAYYSSRFFKGRAFPPPEVPVAIKRQQISDAQVSFRDMTDKEAAGHDTRPMAPEDIMTKDCPSQMADLRTINHDGKVTGILAEGDEYG